MRFQSYKVVVEVTCAVQDGSTPATADVVKEALSVLLHEGSEDPMYEASLAVTDVSSVELVDTDPELIANYQPDGDEP